MTEIDFAYWNFEHGGRRGANSSGDGGAYDFSPLCRVIGHESRWPHILILGEADRYDFNGGEGLWEAAAAMRAAGGRAYTPLMCSLPREWGPFAPAMFVDTQAVQVHRFYDHRLPDFAARRRNTLVARVPGRDDVFQVVTGHGDLSGGEQRLLDARALRPLAKPQVPCIIGMDWATTLSGPRWERRDLNDSTIFTHPSMITNQALWEHGRAQAGPVQPDTRALDYLCGYWLDGQRVGGVGFHWVGELADDDTPTTTPKPNGRQCVQMDGFVVNDPWRPRIVPGSFCVQAELDLDHPDSDHRAVRVTIDV